MREWPPPVIPVRHSPNDYLQKIMNDDKKEQENQRPRPTIITKIESQVG